MTAHLTIREAASLIGCPRRTLFHLLLRKQLTYAQLEPDGPFLLDADEVGALGERGLAWARAWAERHPEVRVDLLEDWATWATHPAGCSATTATTPTCGRCGTWSGTDTT